MMSLLATKLHRPAVPSKRVLRPQLIRVLNAGLASGRQMTLISAPAGCGKSTCAAEWISSLDLPVAWLSLDRSDNDPAHFFIYLVAALQQVDAALGRAIEGLLRAGQLPPSEVISTALINGILGVEGRFLLVLDDFHVIQERPILQVLERLITNQPGNLHLVLLTREDPSLPLARLRANNRLTELRVADLRFDSSEAGRFLNEVMGLSLSPADIALLDAKTEGWIAGLQLAGLSIRDRADPSDFVARLSGRHRFILSYLTEEVLSRQPEDIQGFLLQTSILDRLNGELCDAVTGRPDSAALLEGLCAANLFLIPLDDDRRWYRYHHLFADLLRNLQNTRQKGQTAELHRRASQWYAQAGMPGEAIQHALAAADYATAVQLLEAHATGMIVQGSAQTVEGWLNAISPELRLHSPRANLAFAWMHLTHGAFAQLPPYLERLQALFSGSQEAAEDPSLRAEWLSLQSYLLQGQGKVAESLELAGQALAIAPEEDGYVQTLARNALGCAYLLVGDDAQAAEVYRQAIRHGRASANLMAELLGVAFLSQLTLQRGRYHLAFEITSQIVERLERSVSLPPVSAVVYGALGQVHYQWNQLGPARAQLLRAIELCVRGGYADGEIYHRAIFSRLLQREGESEAAGGEIRKATALMQAGAPAWVQAQVISQQVRIFLAEGHLAAAETALKGYGFGFRDEFTFPGLAPDRTITHEAGLIYNSALRVLLQRAQAKHEPASLRPGIELADRLIRAALQAHYLPIAMETLLIRAQLFAAFGKRPDSLADCGRALELAEAEGVIGLFVEEGLPIGEVLAALLKSNQFGTVQPGFIQSILAEFPEHVRRETGSPAPEAAIAAQDRMIEPLSTRELEILGLIGAGCSNQEIAERLVLSLHTVKKHVSNIFAKLDVNSRTQALARARQLRLL